MLWQHPDHPAARVRLAYCLNLHPAEDLGQMLAGMRSITLPLRDRLARKGESFGAGLYIAAALARELASERGKGDLDRLAEFVATNELDPFTYNAFPAGGFHASGLKAGVFRPTWMEEERVRFTLDVAMVAARLARAAGGPERSHVSLSTHTGAFGAREEGGADEHACARNLARTAGELARLESATGLRTVVSLEAEPRAMSGDNAALERFLARLPEAAGPSSSGEEIRRHVGACLDTCHSAVEFEEPAQAVELATSKGPLGKLQFSSALALSDPRRAESGRAQLLAMDEPRYLHQVTGLSRGPRCEVADLPELRRSLAGGERESWLACREWRCHFHVPVDLGRVGDQGLSTTRDHADLVLQAALADPSRWGVSELHLEIETYTWDVLPETARGSAQDAARGAGDLVDGLAREYAHVMAVLARNGWQRR